MPHRKRRTKQELTDFGIIENAGSRGRPQTDQLVLAAGIDAADLEQRPELVLDHAHLAVLTARKVPIEVRGGGHIAKCDASAAVRGGVRGRAMHHVNVVQADLPRFQFQVFRLCLVERARGQFLVQGQVVGIVAVVIV